MLHGIKTDYWSKFMHSSKMAKQLNILIVFMLCVCTWEVHAAVNCTSTGAGRFADTADTTCQNYTLCVYISSTDSYVSYNYACPATSLFSPTLSQCTTTYTCSATTTNTTNTTTSVCTADGYIADPSSTNCSSYIECVNINGTYEETTYTCPNTTFYNPNTTFCDSSYNCTSTTAFSCSSVGRYANTDDTTCQSYYYCVLLSDGSYTQYNYTCPSTSLFNPTTSLCTASYTCTN